MRQYRAIPIDGKDFVYGGLYELANGMTFIVTSNPFPPSSWSFNIGSFFVSLIEVIPESVGQSTGSKDENGKEIYERDIIELAEDTYGETELSIRCVVKWNDKGFYQLWRNGLIHWKFWRKDTYHNTGYRKNWKVIGNIHQHPKLLEQK